MLKPWKLFIAGAVPLVIATVVGSVVGEDVARPVPEAVAEKFVKQDRDQDKQLSVTEFQAWYGGANAAVALRDFDLFDRNADGQLSLEEYWSLPTHPIGQRGPLHDPLTDVVDQFVGVLDGLLEDWDQAPERTIPVGEFLAAFTKALNEPLTGRMQIEADPNRDRKVSREEARRFVEIQSGVRRSDGQLLRLPDGRLVQHMQFLNADQDRDDRLDQTEFFARAWSPPGKGPETFALTDADKDGFVTWLEWSKIRFTDPIAEFRRMDINFDGQLEPAEVLAGTPDWCKLSAQVSFPAFDRDRSGKLSLDEFRLTFFANPIANWHSIISDTDDDGLLSRQEFSFGGAFPVIRFVYFDLFDANKDGQLDPQEFPFKTKMRRAFYSMNADGTGWTRMFDVAGFPQIGSPAISPDGKWLAFDGHGPKENLSSQMMIMTDLAGGHVRNLGPGMMPNWSKDGRQMCYSHRGLWLMNSEGQEPRQFSNGYSNGWGAQWSPDGTRIVYFAGRNIMTLDVATQKSTVIYNIGEGGYLQTWENMKWSPDSRRICFKGLKPNAVEEIATLVVDPNKVQPNQPRLKVHHSGKSISTHCAWHPGGHRIVFGMYCPERAMQQLYEFNPNTDDPVQLVKGQDPKTPNACAVWTPDGKRLLVIIGDY